LNRDSLLPVPSIMHLSGIRTLFPAAIIYSIRFPPLSSNISAIIFTIYEHRLLQTWDRPPLCSPFAKDTPFSLVGLHGLQGLPPWALLEIQ
jgi:hypothetical protein